MQKSNKVIKSPTFEIIDGKWVKTNQIIKSKDRFVELYDDDLKLCGVGMY